MADPEVFWVRSAGLTHEGEHLELDWKAWRHGGDEAWWELRRVADSMELIQGKYYLDEWLRKHKKQLIAFWGRFGLGEAEAFLPSQKAHAQKARSAGSNVLEPASLASHKVPCLSTAGLLVFLHFAGIASKAAKLRAKSATSWDVFLTRSMLPEFCDSMLEAQLPARWAASCGMPGAGQACAHYDACVDAACGEGLPSQQSLATLLWQLFSAGSGCGACRGYAGELLQLIASHVNENLSTTAYTSDPLAAPPLPTFRERKRPIDEDFKRSVSAKAVTEGRAASGSQYLKATGACSRKNAYRWNDEGLLEHQAASWVGAAPQTLESVIVALDAKRLGNPAENVEVMAACVTASSGSFVSWLPPQAPKHSKHMCVAFVCMCCCSASLSFQCDGVGAAPVV
jgi:hypothetical protein